MSFGEEQIRRSCDRDREGRVKEIAMDGMRTLSKSTCS